MKKEWLDYPIGAFRAAASTMIGSFFLSYFACLVATLLYGVIVMISDGVENGFDFSHLPNWAEVLSLPFVVSGMGILGLYGIPFSLIQAGYFCQILQEENVFRNCFILAYCQVLLTYLWGAIWEEAGFWGWNFACIAITLFILGGTHGFLTWTMTRRRKSAGRTSRDDVLNGEDYLSEKGQLVLPERME